MTVNTIYFLSPFYGYKYSIIFHEKKTTAIIFVEGILIAIVPSMWI